MIVASVALAALARHLASRRFVTQVITGAIVLAAVADLLRENQARSVARLVTWDRKQLLRQELASEARRRKGTRRRLQATQSPDGTLIRNG
jgi:hypothetical protein